MTLLELKIFSDIASEKSFAKAADLNFVTQPSISSHIKHLEEEFGVRLFERVPRNVRLTREGALLLPYVRDILLKADNLKILARKSKKLPQGNIRSATIHSIGIYELSPILKKFMAAYPQINLHLQYRRADAIYELVLKNEVDFGIVAYPEDHHGIKVIPFTSDNLVLITPADHPLGKKQRVPLKKIQGENFIAFDDGIPTRKAIDKILAAKRVDVSIRMTNDNVDTLKSAVEVGLGISIVPSKTVVSEVQRGALRAVQISDAKLTRPLGILLPKGRELNYPVQIFLKTLTQKSELFDLPVHF